MENANFIENMATRLGQSATVKNVYGDPIVMDGKTIVPVATIRYGFGGGFGQKGNKNRGATEPGAEATQKAKAEEGAGGGGGMVACARGVYEITATGTRFIPANNIGQLLLAAFGGFLLAGLVMRRR